MEIGQRKSVRETGLGKELQRGLERLCKRQNVREIPREQTVRDSTREIVRECKEIARVIVKRVGEGIFDGGLQFLYNK